MQFKGVMSRDFAVFRSNSVLNSLLSAFTHITYKGELSRGFCCVQVNSALNSLLSAFTHTQNAPVKLRGRYQMNFIVES